MRRKTLFPRLEAFHCGGTLSTVLLRAETDDTFTYSMDSYSKGRPPSPQGAAATAMFPEAQDNLRFSATHMTSSDVTVYGSLRFIGSVMIVTGDTS
jgi:hypothetical protein